MNALPQSMEVYQPTGEPLTASAVRAHVNLIQEVMAAVMKKDVHYGIIPGCKKPSLWKPGAEVLFMTFRIAVDVMVVDLSTPDEARFRVQARATSYGNVPLGTAVGEASTGEEKYKWRAAICDEEWEATPEDRRRTKWKNGRNDAYPVQQIRTEIADNRNTALKMAAKRATVALALQVTAASDIFTQDIEDIPEEARGEVYDDVAQQPAPNDLPTEIRRKPQPAPQGRGPTTDYPPVHGNSAGMKESERKPQPPQPRAPEPSRVRTISEPQARRFYAIRTNTGRSDDEVRDFLKAEFGVDDDRKIPADRYEFAIEWAQGDF
jgi:hypothetical protein